ncbi:MAG: SDR family oxidoreductase [Nitrososphaerota archaeon]
MKGKVAIITGGAKGFGKAIALRLSKKGVKTAIVDIDEKSGMETCMLMREEGGESEFFLCDVGVEDDVKRMVEGVHTKFGSIDFLVNNAGIMRVGLLWETPTDVFDEIVRTNLRGPFLCMKYVVPVMINQRAGRIVNVSSAIGRQAQPLMAAYAATKAGLIAMTVALAKEVGEYGITVNAVCPGPVETSLWVEENKKVLSKILNVSEGEVVKWFTMNKQVIKKPLQVSDIANVVCWLLSPETEMITGQAIGIDGGHDFPTF